MPEFALGWNPVRAGAARAQMILDQHYCTVIEGIETPPAISLSQYVIRAMEQGQAGTCWVHAGVCLAETFASSHGYTAFPICRRLVGWEGKQLEGGGNPTNGGAVTDALKAMMVQYAGIAHEELCPYSDSSGVLGQKPPSNVWDDAKKANLVLPVDVTDDSQCQTLVANLHPVSIGTWWPFNFDDRQTFMTSIGRGTYGHALTIIGYVKPGVWPGDYGKHGWFQWRNWHGQLYPPLTQELAALVPGYKSDNPTTTSDFWVRDDLQKDLQRRGNFEYVSATDLSGLGKIYKLPSFSTVFPI